MNAFQANRPLEPLGVAGIIRASLGVLFGNLLALIGIPLILLAGMMVAVAAVMVPLALGNRVIPAMLESPAEWPLGMALAILIGVLVLLAIPFLVLWAVVGGGALIAAMGGGHLGQRLGIGGAFGVGMRRALPLLGATILSRLIIAFFSVPAVFLLMASGLLAAQGQATRDPQLQLLAIPFLCITPFLLVVALFVTLRLLFVPFTAVFEEVGPIAAVERSWAVSRGHLLRIFGYLILLSVIAGGIAVLAQLLLQWLLRLVFEQMGPPSLPAMMMTEPGPWLQAAASTSTLAWVAVASLVLAYVLVITLVSLAIEIAFVVLYFDIRHRDEGFGVAAGEPEPIPPPEGEPAPSDQPMPSDEPGAAAIAEEQAEAGGLPVAEAAAVAVVAEELSEEQPSGEQPSEEPDSVAPAAVAAVAVEEAASAGDDADAFEAAAAEAAEEVAQSEEEAPDIPAVAEDAAPAEPPAWASLPVESEGTDSPRDEGG